MNIKDLTARLLAAANLTANEEADLLEAAAEALTRLTAGGVELPEELTDFVRQLVHGDFSADFPADLSSALKLTEQIQDYGDRRAAAAVLSERERIATKFESMQENGDVYITTVAASALVRKGTP